MNTECKICKHESKFLFNGDILNKHKINYYQCSNCNFIQTEHPFWLDEAYQSAIGMFDIGLLTRNINLCEQVVPVLELVDSDTEAKFIDYGGGFGIFVRLMRDKGYDFYLYDKYCDNLFAKFFESKDAATEMFSALTSFEVFEHLQNPVAETAELWKLSDTIIFSTELQPDATFNSVNDWWYFAPHGGQHIALYHKKTLEELAKQFQCKFFTNGTNLHVFTKKNIQDPFITSDKKSILEKIGHRLVQTFGNKQHKRKTLLFKDVEYLKTKLS